MLFDSYRFTMFYNVECMNIWRSARWKLGVSRSMLVLAKMYLTPRVLFLVVCQNAQDSARRHSAGSGPVFDRPPPTGVLEVAPGSGPGEENPNSTDASISSAGVLPSELPPPVPHGAAWKAHESYELIVILGSTQTVLALARRVPLSCG